MMIIKHNFQINDHFLNDLSHLINGKIKLISSCGSPVDLESSDKPYDNISIAVACKNVNYNISIRSIFFYSENIDNDFYLVSDLKMGEGFASEDIWANNQKIKCHYEIGEKEVIKFIDKEMPLYE